MNIVIAGGGIAGLSAATVLRRLPFVKSILILEPAAVTAVLSSSGSGGNGIKDAETNIQRSSTHYSHLLHSNSHHSNEIHNSNTHRYNGLWGPALHCLQSLGLYSKIAEHIHPVRSSGFKDIAGRWLAQPRVGLLEPPNNPSLAFIDNEELLKVVREAAFDSDNGYCPVSIVYGKRLSDVQHIKTSLSIKDSSGALYPADLLIAADGTFSSVFSLLHGSDNVNHPRFRGYKVYRGYSEKIEGKLEIEKIEKNERKLTTISNVDSDSYR
jgi:2-polyprenyl-6-methoxyphenol hydroxylase-like FAD-dependent oxidoreductase